MKKANSINCREKEGRKLIEYCFMIKMQIWQREGKKERNIVLFHEQKANIAEGEKEVDTVS